MRPSQVTQYAARLEEAHLAAELAQMQEFDREKQACATQIRHMEGYCTTQSPSPTPLSEDDIRNFIQIRRALTQRQKDFLEQRYHDRETMDILHEAKIKVLRDRQELLLQAAVARKEAVHAQLIVRNSQVYKVLEMRCNFEYDAAIQTFRVKKERLKRRWALEGAITMKKLEGETGLEYAPLPELSFTQLDPVNESGGTAV
jgi:hypothetical protein